jgi:hypothetical protein
VFTGTGEVHIEWTLGGIRIRALSATAMVLAGAVAVILIWLVNFYVGALVGLVLELILLYLTAKLNSMADLGGSGYHADIGEWSQLMLLWSGTRTPVVTNTGAKMTKSRKG